MGSAEARLPLQRRGESTPPRQYAHADAASIGMVTSRIDRRKRKEKSLGNISTQGTPGRLLFDYLLITPQR